MIFQTFGKIKTTTIMTSIVLIAIGVVMLLCPEPFINTLIDLMGYVILVLAAVMILDFISSKKGVSDYISFTIGLLFLIAGIAVLVFTNNILAVISWVFGILLILDGLRSVINTVVFVRRSGRSAWIFLLILSILLIAVGVLILVNPWWTTSLALLRVIGWAILFSALVSILRVILVWPFRSE